MNQRSATSCRGPRESLVQLEVPEGFDYVRPSVVSIRQCSGFSCSSYQTKCQPTSFTKKTLTVEAFRSGEDHLPTCAEVVVTEHTGCECRCDWTPCPDNQLFDPDACKCTCDPSRERLCNDKRVSGVSVQWSRKACKCQCISPPNCSSSQDWNESLCSCIYKEEAIKSRF